MGESIAYNDLIVTDLTDNSGVTVEFTVGVGNDAVTTTLTLQGVSENDLSANDFNLPDGSTTSLTTAENDTLEVWSSSWEGTENGDFMLDDSPATHIKALGGSETTP